MRTYQVTAKRWEHGWELHIHGVGATQARNVSEAPRMVEDYLRIEGVAEPFDIEITYTAEPDLVGEIEEARQATAAADAAQAEAAEKRRAVVRKLRQRNYRSSEVARVLGVSKQRISQILKEDA